MFIIIHAVLFRRSPLKVFIKLYWKIYPHSYQKLLLYGIIFSVMSVQFGFQFQFNFSFNFELVKQIICTIQTLEKLYQNEIITIAGKSGKQQSWEVKFQLAENLVKLNFVPNRFWLCARRTFSTKAKLHKSKTPHLKKMD